MLPRPLVAALTLLMSTGCVRTQPVADTLSDPLPRSSLAAAGDAPAQWGQFVAALESNELAIDSVSLTVEGAIVAEHHRDRHGLDTLHDLRSSTKSITSLLVGVAIDRGLIESVDAPIAPYFLDYTPHPSWASQRELTIEDLLTMRSGLDCDDWVRRSPGNEEKMYRSRDWIGFFFDIPSARPPGEAFRYCTAGVVVLGEIVARAAGRPLPELAQTWLFEPLGVHTARWQLAPHAVTDAGGHLQLSAESLTKIGLLVLAGGRHDGHELVSQRYLDAMLTPHTSIGPRDQPGPRYGYLWWLEPVVDGVVRSYQARGNGGQLLIVLPELGAVVTFTGSDYNDHTRQMLRFELTARHLIPMLRAGDP